MAKYTENIHTYKGLYETLTSFFSHLRDILAKAKKKGEKDDS